VASAPDIRVAVLGVSIDDPCGVRDHAALLAEALGAQGVSCSLHWLSRSGGSLAPEHAEVRDWAQATARELRQDPPQALLLHYSVFALSHRGVPLLLRPVLSALRTLQLPLVGFMHELAYPWRLGGPRGKVWAATQRVALRRLVHDCAGIVVTAEARAEWLRTRAWLPSRPTAVAPVFPNLPGADRLHAVEPGRLGLFGYAHEGVARTVVLDALRLARERHGELRLELLGAPGSSSPAGEGWREAAAGRGLSDALGFSERLPAQQLADALASCELLLFAERGGPTSRKTTLAAALASGRPLVALDGPNGWRELLAARAVRATRPDGPALAEAIVGLLADEDARARLGERGRAFAERTMSVEHSASVVAGALARALGGGTGG
jgi:glycosyltransferase involved in cell wall biosynthesis